MRFTNPDVKKLVEKYREISLLYRTGSVLDWDLEVNLPPKAAAGRAKQLAYLTQLTTERWLDPKFRRLLEKVSTHTSSLTKEEQAIIRNLNWAGKYYFKVPKEVIVEITKTSAEAFMIWQKARKENRFGDFLPSLKKLIGLSQDVIRHLGYQDDPYNALLDLFEPELTVDFCRETFATLQPPLTSLLKDIKASPRYIEKSELLDGARHYPIETQRQLALFLMRKMGYDLEAGRLDVATHPFESALDRYDVRITTRYKEHDFRDSFAVIMHEAGHALYEQGVNPDYSETPLEHGVSFGIHESQSRFWENAVGRSPTFLRFMTPVFQAFFPEALGTVETETLVRLFNQAKPSLIRVEADEVTYNLHIILRFDLEQALMNEKLKAEKLPEVWRAKMKEYLGLAPETDREGVLQDVHWSHASFGYFPSYTLGNFYAAQFMNKMKGELDLDRLLEKGEFGPMLAWLRENIHRHGSLYWPTELAQRVTGEALNPQYFLDYLDEKYRTIYDLKEKRVLTRLRW